MMGTGVEGGVIEQLRATVRIDVSATPTASDTSRAQVDQANRLLYAIEITYVYD